MKKLLLKLVVYCLPFLVVLGCFLALEPYDYFGLRGGDYTYLSRPLSSVRELQREQPKNIILGDSRMANLNTDYIYELTGEEYFMLGFGGAQSGELLELFWYAAETTNLEKVVFGINLYTSCGAQDAGRATTVLEQAEDPSAFLLHPNYWLEAINNSKMKLVNLYAEAANKPHLMQFHEDPSDYTLPQDIPTEPGEVYRADLEEYCELLKIGLTPSSEIEDQFLQRLGEVIDYCDENDIELIFVYPPMHESVMKLVIEAQGLDVQMAKYKNYLAERAIVYDMEFLNDFTTNADNFIDGFHLVNSKKQYLAELIFTDIEAGCILRSYPTND